MKPVSLLLTIGLLLGCTACATLDVAEIATLRKVPFEPLRLVPEAEPTELRIDLIRQKTQHQSSSNTVIYENMPYHPLGFELGNGLFYDLNGNLSLRVSYLLGIDEARQYKIRRADLSRGRRGVVYYTFRQDSLLKSYGYKDRVDDLYFQQGEQDSLAIRGGFARNYAIVKNDTSVQYRVGKRTRELLQKQADSSYVRERWLTTWEYQQQGRQVTLGKHFQIELTNSDRTILIRGNSVFNRKVLYTLERSDDKILVYTDRGSGNMIKLGTEAFALYRNRKLQDKYALLPLP